MRISPGDDPFPRAVTRWDLDSLEHRFDQKLESFKLRLETERWERIMKVYVSLMVAVSIAAFTIGLIAGPQS